MRFGQTKRSAERRQEMLRISIAAALTSQYVLKETLDDLVGQQLFEIWMLVV